VDHAQFVAGWQAGKLKVDVNRSLALQVANSDMLPRQYRAAHTFWSWIWILSIPAGLAVMFLFRWWAGLLMLILLTPGLSRATKTSAMQFMIDHAIENPEFYSWALDKELLVIAPKS
jgi:hypothetical protein